MSEKTYIAIDLKSFYASVECMERGLDPLTTNLVVADESRTTKTICLAVSPSLKAHGIPGRPRLFEVVEKVKLINARRRQAAPGHVFTGRSSDADALARDPSLELDYIIAAPRMAYYMEYSARVFSVYLKYIAPEDIHVYSIDEVFIDATAYLRGRTARDFARMLIRDVLRTCGIVATAGIGPNLYLCKIAMDIGAKHIPADADGVRIAELDERKYREQLWDHRPLTDFWRLGRGYARKLERIGLYTMGDIARCSLDGAGEYHNEELLYKLFGINAELLIDHAWGWEPCTLRDIKSYRPESHSISVGQVLSEPYPFDRARIILREMAEGLVFDLVEKRLVTDQLVLTVGYDTAGATPSYTGPVETDPYGRRVPKSVHGSENIGQYTSSTRQILDAALRLFDRIVDPALPVRRMVVAANHASPAEEAAGMECRQLDLFTDQPDESEAPERERRLQDTMLSIKRKYGKNAILHGTSYQEGATGRERNRQIGGHKA
ncbi:MAG: DNA methylase [Oscillospiraceae bacterium]